MLVDWFTVIAQLINFLLLVWLLKRFLYQPILRAIDSREQRLRDAQTLALQEQEQARALQQRLQQEKQALEEQQEAMLHQAQLDAEQEKQRLLETARQEVTRQRHAWLEQLGQEERNLQNNLRDLAQQELIATVRHILQHLAERSLEEQIARIFMAELGQLAAEQKQQLATACGERPLWIHSSGPLSETQQQELVGVLKQELGCEMVRFQQDPALICGLELHSDGNKISWNINAQLQSLQDQLQQLLRQSLPQHDRGSTP